ncbi:MAG: carboxypeptidase-like regulatory domain-containing protein, partial [Bacteroidales bacterium]
MRISYTLLFIWVLLLITPVYAQQREITGKVIDADTQEPLIGATVSVKDAIGRGVITDLDGQYRLTIDTGNKILVFSYIGMKSQEFKIPGNGILNVALQQDTRDLEEVVVTGYGNFSKSSFTGSANTLRADMLKNVPVLSVEQKLQGMTTGVNITSGSGQPGANQSIRIRGMGSFNASQEPLFVIDGVPVSSGSLSSGGSGDAAY